MKKLFAIGSLGFAVLLMVAATADAGLVIYTNSAAWNADVTGVSTVSIPDPGAGDGKGPLGTDVLGVGDASVTFGSDIFSTSSSLGNAILFNIGTQFSGSPAVLSSQATDSGSGGQSNLLITFAGNETAFGLNFGSLFGDTVTFTLSNGDSFTETPPSNYDYSIPGSGYAVPTFAGVTDTNPFNSVLLTTSSDVIDTVNVNNVSTATAVPEPTTFALLGFGGIGLAIRAYRRRMTAV